MTKSERRQEGPVSHRLLVFVLSVVFGLLFFWLLGFVINDIGTLPGPDYGELQEKLMDQKLIDKKESLEEQVEDVKQEIDETQTRQGLLKDSIDSSRRTINQLLEIQRLSLEKGSEFSEAEKSAMSESIELFLSNQRQYQTYNDQISELKEELIDLEKKQRENNERLEEAREPIREEYDERMERHNLWLASLKLAVLIPLLLIVLVLFLKKRDSIYTPLIHATTIAVAVKVMLVMHQHFPERYFKYILVVVALAIVTWVLVSLLRMVAFPKKDWLLKQYRDSYEAFLCPVCSYPIRRGPLKYMSWTRRSIRRVAPSMPTTDTAGWDEPYTCPMCATRVFEQCEHCGETRHSLLPACTNCGTEKAVKRETAEPPDVPANHSDGM